MFNWDQSIITERKIPYGLTCVWNLKNKTKQNPSSSAQRMNWWFSETGEGREGKMGEGSQEVPTCNYKVNKSQEYKVQLYKTVNNAVCVFENC